MSAMHHPMHYISTRGDMPPKTFTEILLGGLAPDGGLVLPESIPRVDRSTLARWRTLSYPELAFELLSLYATDIPSEDLHRLVTATYTAEKFGGTDITPLKIIDDGESPLALLRLSNGPTLAFKDVAMQMLGALFEYVLLKEDRWLNILGATSGDTGSAAEYAMLGKRNIRVFMLSPYGRMSRFQRAQMYSLCDPNIFNIVVPGFFDDCQDMVKAVSRDLRFKERHDIGTVNSINWARVVAQVVYYFKGYFTATKGEDDEVAFTVPTGNFGNVLAAHIARSMGLPVRRIVVATNENDVLDEFFRTGRYRVRSSAQTFETSSPSMDISKASNFERYVYDLVGRDARRLKGLFDDLDRVGEFDLSSDPAFAAIRETGFVSGRSTHADRMQTIRRYHRERGILVDTHTADALHVAEAHREAGLPMICLETALPAKFADAVREATGEEPPVPEAMRALESKVQRFTLMPADVRMLKSYIAAHTG